jgi:hypothetical protein
MTCIATLYDQSKNKAIKNIKVEADTYALCEVKIKEMNESIKYPKKYVITIINV